MQEREGLAAGLLEAQASAALAAVRAQEIERRALELRTELDHAHRDVAQARSELAQAHADSVNEIKAARAEAASLVRQGGGK